jgi:hypothetical protein
VQQKHWKAWEKSQYSCRNTEIKSVESRRKELRIRTVKLQHKQSQQAKRFQNSSSNTATHRWEQQKRAQNSSFNGATKAVEIWI